MAPTTTIRNLILAALCATSATASYIQVNYYYDGGCSDYASQPPNVPYGSVYNWSWDHSGSANIANCDDYDFCSCTFFTQSNGGGPRYTVQPGSCATNWPYGFKSFECTYGNYFPKEKRSVEETVEGNI
jgi:hypothetical protein